MSNELLPKVELWRVSDPAIQTLEDLMRRVLAEMVSTPVGAMRAAAAAAYIGVGRSTFYQLLRQDAQLAGSSFGVGTARMWRKEDLDAWMQAQVGPEEADLTSQAPR